MTRKEYLPFIRNIFVMGQELEKFGPYIGFVALCFIYGSSYAFISKLITTTDPPVFSFLRMFFALLTTIAIFMYKYTAVNGYRESVNASLKDGTVSPLKCFIGGIIGLGVPTSLITIAQKSVPSVIVTLVQPSIPLFSLVLAHFVFPNERITFKKVFVHLIALIGALLTIIPSLQLDNASLGGSNFFHYILLFLGLFFYGLGSIYIKLFMTQGDTALCCTFSLSGSVCYNLVFLLINKGFFKMFGSIFAISFINMMKILVFSIFYSALPSFFFIYVIRELGPVKANLTDFGQIVIGIFFGVVILDEWKGLRFSDKLINWIGIIQIMAALLYDFSGNIQSGSASVKSNDEEVLLNSTRKFSEDGFETAEE